MYEIEISDFITSKFDITIDARSPREFAYSKVPNSLNLYALNDSEFEEIGRIYKQSSKERAKILGSSYICQNMSRHILEFSKQYKIGSKIAIYCAKGGLRSLSVGLILSNLGYRVFRIKGGYKAYRNYVLDFLEKDLKFRLIVLHGNTGCGKTEILKNLSPAINLEALVNHYGSVFGSIKGKQPSQKAFENELFAVLFKLQDEKFVFIEGESRKIGSLTIPKKLYEKMQEGIFIQINSSIKKRIEQILKDYQSLNDDFFYQKMSYIKKYMPKKIYTKIIQAYKTKDLNLTVELLLLEYYDKVYKKPEKIHFSLEANNAKIELEKLMLRGENECIV